MNDLANSINPNRPIPGIEKAKLRAWPQELIGMECMFGEVYTYLKPKQKRFDLYNLIEEAVAAKEGHSVFDFEKGILTCKMNLMGNNQQAQQTEFTVEIFESREWKDQYKKLDEADEVVERNEHQIFITRINRIGGDRLSFDKLKKGFLLMYVRRSSRDCPNGRVKWRRRTAITWMIRPKPTRWNRMTKKRMNMTRCSKRWPFGKRRTRNRMRRSKRRLRTKSKRAAAVYE